MVGTSSCTCAHGPRDCETTIAVCQHRLPLRKERTPDKLNQCNGWIQTLDTTTICGRSDIAAVFVQKYKKHLFLEKNTLSFILFEVVGGYKPSRPEDRRVARHAARFGMLAGVQPNVKIKDEKHPCKHTKLNV